MPSQNTDIDLLSELQSNNAYFDSIVNMIPARIYVAGASGDDAFHAKYQKGKQKESKEARQARNKIAKRDKFDPEKMETTLETKKRVKREIEENESDDESEDGDIEMSDGDGDGDDEDDTGPATQPVREKEAAPSNNDSYASRIEMLRAKLHTKMAEKRAAAGITPSEDVVAGTNNAASIDPSAPPLVSKRAGRRAEKQKRKKAAIQRDKKKADSVAERQQADQKPVVNLGGSTPISPTISDHPLDHQEGK